MIFNTLLEGMPVEVHWIYEADGHGIYDSHVEFVIYKGIDVAPVLSEETLYELDAESLAYFKEVFCD